MFDQKFDRKHIKYAWNCCTSEKLFQHLAEFVGNLGQRMDRVEALDLDKYADTIKEIQSDISSLTSSIEMVRTTATGNTESIVNLLTNLETLTEQVDALAEGTTVEMDDLDQQINDVAGTITDIQILISNIETKLNTIDDNYDTLSTKVTAMEDSYETLDTTVSTGLATVNERIDNMASSEEEWQETITSQMDTLTSHFSDIEEMVYGFNSDIVSMKSDITSLESDVNTVTDKCDALEDEMISCCDQVNDSLGELKENVSDVATSVSDVSERVTVLENTEQVDLSEIETKISGLENSTDSLSNSIDKINENMEQMQGDVTGCVQIVAQTQQNIEELDDRVTVLEQEESDIGYEIIHINDITIKTGGITSSLEIGMFNRLYQRLVVNYDIDFNKLISAQFFPTSIYMVDTDGTETTYTLNDVRHSSSISENPFACIYLNPLVIDNTNLGIKLLIDGRFATFFGSTSTLNITFDLTIMLEK